MAAPRGRWRFAAGIFALALLVRLAYLLDLREHVLFSVLVGDAEAFHLWATRLAGGDWIGAGAFYQAPGYPYLLGLLYTVLPGPLAARVAQALLGALTCVVMSRVADRGFGRAVGRGTGVALALYAPLVFYEGQLLKPALALLLLALLLLVLLRLHARPARRDAFALGLCFGALVLTRENLALLVPLVGYAGWRARAAARWALPLGLAVALAPLIARNLAAGVAPLTLTTNLGPNLYIGNNPDADGLYRPLVPGRGIHGAEAADALRLARAATGAELDAAGASRYWRDEALAWLAAHPGAGAALFLRKLRYALHDCEWADTESYLVYRDASTVLGLLGGVLRFGVLVALAAAGAVLTRGSARGYLLAAAALVLLGVAPFFVFGRLRLPLVPLLMPFAVAALASAAARVARGRARDVGVAAALALAFGVLAFAPAGPAVTPRADTWNSVGNALQRVGRGAEARAALERALDEAPAAREARFNLGLLLAQEGELERAQGLLVGVARDEPAWKFEAHQILARAFLDAGDTERASTHLLRARGSAGGPRESQLELGIVARRLGDHELAEAIYRDLIAAEPDFADAYNNLGFLHFGRLRWADARAAYDAALRLAPEHASALYRLAWLLAAAPDPAVRDGARAVRLAERWRGLPDADGPAGLDLLAAALAETGDFAAALAAADRALAAARDAGRASDAASIERHRAAYRQRRPWRLEGS
jgi:tetratricopeptide (TPR) repeat protein